MLVLLVPGVGMGGSDPGAPPIIPGALPLVGAGS